MNYACNKDKTEDLYELSYTHFKLHVWYMKLEGAIKNSSTYRTSLTDTVAEPFNCQTKRAVRFRYLLFVSIIH